MGRGGMQDMDQRRRVCGRAAGAAKKEDSWRRLEAAMPEVPGDLGYGLRCVRAVVRRVVEAGEDPSLPSAIFRTPNAEYGRERLERTEAVEVKSGHGSRGRARCRGCPRAKFCRGKVERELEY